VLKGRIFFILKNPFFKKVPYKQKSFKKTKKKKISLRITICSWIGILGVFNLNQIWEAHVTDICYLRKNFLAKAFQSRRNDKVE